MFNYLYFRHEEQALQYRFDAEDTGGNNDTVAGLSDWRELIELLLLLLNGEAAYDIRGLILTRLHSFEQDSSSFGRSLDSGQENRSTEELILVLLLVRLRQSYQVLPPGPCPRLFISHRQSDKNYALRMAQLAVKNGFAFWLDILDPGLNLLSGNHRIPAHLVPLLTACMIEMALINCTHVLACMTPDTRGSLWVPYEYGRISQLPGPVRTTCAWRHPDLLPHDFPEYMYLGEIARTETEIERWLTMAYPLNNGPCDVNGHDLRSFDLITELPEGVEKVEARDTRKEFNDWLDAGMPLTRDIIAPMRAKFRGK